MFGHAASSAFSAGHRAEVGELALLLRPFAGLTGDEPCMRSGEEGDREGLGGNFVRGRQPRRLKMIEPRNAGLSTLYA